MRKVTVWVVLLLGVSTLASCGMSGDKQGDQSVTAIPGAATAAADITSGCWTADERVKSAGGGERSVAHQQWSKPPAMTIDPSKKYTATIKTNKGDIEVEFFPQDAPQTVNNFICLAKAGYYDNTPFHRIIPGFVIQGGDPTGTGAGGPGYKFADEPIHRDYLKGTLAMANSGPNTNGSQFFIVLGDLRGQLQKNYTIFGQVTG
ncbi:MAG TPA: peptidylprolyl isomerase, partial [Thermomicrobiales bacterium]|nr:peptidylprolyl isomerase [Thermomicrobiales bacterium]